MDYKKILEARLEEFDTRTKHDDFIDPVEATMGLDFTKDNRAYFAGLIKLGIISKANANAAMARGALNLRLAKELGEAPQTAREYARIYAEREKITISYKGAITAPGRETFSLLDLSRGARLTAGELGVPFHRDAINDGVADHYLTARDQALDGIRKAIDPRAEFDWIKLTSACFSRSCGSPEFVAAVFKKFVWQVKRKFYNMTVPFPLMPVLQGAQNSGKSWFVKAFLAAIAELVSESDFSAIADDRNIDLWRSFVIFLDEMAKAAKSDVETIKHVITSTHLERRPMRENTSVTIRQCATFIGATNSSLAELIKDETGNRRFVELRWIKPPEGFIDSFDFKLAWQSVHQDDADPMAEYMDTLAELQAESRNHGPVESWLIGMDGEDWDNLHEKADDGFILTQRLFDAYLVHRSLVNGGVEMMQDRRTLYTFSHELSRITGSSDYGIVKHRTSKANGWRITKPSNVPVLSTMGGRTR